jgi:hypothetical protein
MTQHELFPAWVDPAPKPAISPAAALRVRDRYAAALERFPARPTDMDIAMLYCHAAVALCPDGWLGEALNAHVEADAVRTFGVDALELFWRLHPGYSG